MNTKEGAIYLDYMATTPMDPLVKELMCECMCADTTFANPASISHGFGMEAKKKVEMARAEVADLLQAEPHEIIWTSGATEADNLAIIGVAEFYQRQGKHIITMASEHKAVLDTCRHLESRGFEVTYLNPQRNGLLDLKELEAAIRDDTILVSVMWVNNETGVVQDIPAITQLVKSRGILMHTDAVQAIGKVAIDLKQVPVDLLSCCAHKVYGPKGVGALYVRQKPKVRLTAQIHGGGHERGYRSGTLATHQIVGMGKAFSLAKQRADEDKQHAEALSQLLLTALQDLGGVHLNGDSPHKIPNCLNLQIEGVRNDALTLSLPTLGFSTGSACNAAKSSGSHVLAAMGLTEKEANESIRLSFGHFTEREEVLRAVKLIEEQVKRLRALSPIME